MADIVDKATRSRMMAGIKAQNTKPELLVRRELHRRGFRFRLHDRKLPGSPDIILPRWRTVIFVHGCFWHRHAACRLAYEPKSNILVWQKKFAANISRDRKTYDELRKAGWRVVIIWECATRARDSAELGEEVAGVLTGDAGFSEINADYAVAPTFP
jgi:DNA mismatch endonuclease, patch repair protein